MVHLHGAHVRSESDGYPMNWLVNGEEQVYHYPNNQLATTMWYHDHVMSRTRVNVYAGLAGIFCSWKQLSVWRCTFLYLPLPSFVGFYLLRDKNEDEIGLPAGEYEMPLVIQDRILQNDSQASTLCFLSCFLHPLFAPHFLTNFYPHPANTYSPSTAVLPIPVGTF